MAQAQPQVWARAYTDRDPAWPRWASQALWARAEHPLPPTPTHASLVLEDLVCCTCQGTGRNDGCLHGVGYQEPERASLTLTLFLLTPRPPWLSDAHNSTIKASLLWGKPNWDFSPY